MSAPNDRIEQNATFDSDWVGRGQKACRACTDIKSWMAYGKSKESSKEKSSPETNTNESSPESQRHKECPLDKDELGRNTWGFLHTMAAYYPDKPTTQQQHDMKSLIHTFAKFYPCDFCAEDFRKTIKQYEPDTSSQHKLSQWMCQQHNIVNRKLGKPEFDCSRVNERWRDGWKDGSCD